MSNEDNKKDVATVNSDKKAEKAEKAEKKVDKKPEPKAKVEPTDDDEIF